MFPYGHNGAFVSLPLRNSYLFGSISYSTFLILFNSGFIVPCFGLALPLTFRGFAMVGQSKHKSSILHKSSIEELPLNFAVSPHYCKTLVVRLCWFLRFILLNFQLCFCSKVFWQNLKILLVHQKRLCQFYILLPYTSHFRHHQFRA